MITARTGEFNEIAGQIFEYPKITGDSIGFWPFFYQQRPIFCQLCSCFYHQRTKFSLIYGHIFFGRHLLLVCRRKWKVEPLDGAGRRIDAIHVNVFFYIKKQKVKMRRLRDSISDKIVVKLLALSIRLHSQFGALKG